MKFFLELGNRYAKTSTWLDFALVKFCLCALGILLGLTVPGKAKKPAAKAALGVFAATYIPLMGKVFFLFRRMQKELDQSETVA